MIKLLFILLSFVAWIDCFGILFWNLRTFGKNRATNENGQSLYQITNAYDVLLFAEIKDSDCQKDMDCPLKTFFQTHFQDYELYLSPTLHYCDHRNAGSEEYALLVRKGLFSSTKMVHYDDQECLFIRPPYGLEVEMDGEKLNILLFHSNPNNLKELVELAQVFRQFGNRKTILMGDLNTGCHYVSFDTLKSYDIGKNYTWLLSEKTFTNVEQTCPYDRIIFTNDIANHGCRGDVMNKNNEAKRIQSDHYPISIEYKLSVQVK
jgi:hypothetical protein